MRFRYSRPCAGDSAILFRSADIPVVNEMRIRILFPVILAVIPALTLAQTAETRCTNGDTVRRVVIMSEPGVSVPCEVHYFRDTEAPGEDQVLWSANSQHGYCEEKAAGLVSKLEGWGWTCSAVETPAAPPVPPQPTEPAAAPEVPEEPEEPEEPVDMTEDLAPPVPEDNGD